MIVITLTDCPPALRGDLTKWLQEINTGVYVGHVSARVRDEIWKRVRESAKGGPAPARAGRRPSPGIGQDVESRPCPRCSPTANAPR